MGAGDLAAQKAVGMWGRREEGELAVENPALQRAPRALSLCLQAVPPGPGGRAPESDLARPTASAADCPEAALLPRGLQAGSRTPGGGAGCPELSQGKGV